MILRKYDRVNKFRALFDTISGTYIRSGVLDEGGKDTNIDPFMTTFPELIDIGVMGHCAHGKSGLCVQSGVQCYQNGLSKQLPNMTLENYKKIIDECKDKTFQVALGGRGDVDMHENFEDLLQYACQNNIVPNFTTSGLGMTEEKAKICKKYCGAVAVSWYRYEHTAKAINLLLEAGVTTNIHYVLGKNSIDEAISILRSKSLQKGVNAIVFLLHKPVGQGTIDNMLTVEDTPKLKEFCHLVDTAQLPFKIGFDSCSIPMLLSYCENINKVDIDTCEGARFSMYISSDMIALPCSFDNVEQKWAYDLKDSSIQSAWDSPQFESFRSHLKLSCPTCSEREYCMGGCPIRREIVLCNSSNKN